MFHVTLEIVDLERDDVDVSCFTVFDLEAAHDIRLNAHLQYDAHHSEIDVTDDDNNIRILVVGNNIL